MTNINKNDQKTVWFQNRRAKLRRQLKMQPKIGGSDASLEKENGGTCKSVDQDNEKISSKEQTDINDLQTDNNKNTPGSVASPISGDVKPEAKKRKKSRKSTGSSPDPRNNIKPDLGLSRSELNDPSIAEPKTDDCRTPTGSYDQCTHSNDGAFPQPATSDSANSVKYIGSPDAEGNLVPYPNSWVAPTSNDKNEQGGITTFDRTNPVVHPRLSPSNSIPGQPQSCNISQSQDLPPILPQTQVTSPYDPYRHSHYPPHMQYSAMAQRSPTLGGPNNIPVAPYNPVAGPPLQPNPGMVPSPYGNAPRLRFNGTMEPRYTPPSALHCSKDAKTGTHMPCDASAPPSDFPGHSSMMPTPPPSIKSNQSSPVSSNAGVHQPPPPPPPSSYYGDYYSQQYPARFYNSTLMHNTPQSFGSDVSSIGYNPSAVPQQ